MAAERYQAFISYSHKDRDFAEWLHRALEAYRIDRDLVGRETPVGPVPKTLRPIFRDRDDFAGGPSLTEATFRALQDSKFLIALCSPNSRQSYYVNEEVRLFKQLGRADRVIPVILAGEPDNPERECFPPAVIFNVGADGQITNSRAEPIAADAREEGDGRDIAKQKIVAGLLGIGLDEIRKRAASAARRRHILVSSVAVAMTGLAVVASIAAWIARQRTIEAEQRLDWALETAGAVTTKTVGFKSKFGVPVPVLSELLAEVEQLLGRLDQQGVQSSALKVREARLLQALSDNNKDLGDTTKALDEATQSLARLAAVEASDGKTSGTDNDIGWANLKIGDLHKQRNALQLAEGRYTAAKEIFASLTSSEPNNITWQSSLAASLGRLSDAFSAEGKLSDAAAMLDQDVAILRGLHSANPQDTFQSATLATALAGRATVAETENNANNAVGLLQEAETIDKALVGIDPTNSDWATNLAFCERALGYATERTGNLTDAVSHYESAQQLYEKLSAEDPTNVSKKDLFADTLDTLGYDYQRTNRMKDAADTFEKQIDIRRQIIARDPNDGAQRATLVISLNRLAYAQVATGDTNGALPNVNESLELSANLIKEDPSNLDLKTGRTIALGMAALMATARGDQSTATHDYEEMAKLGNEIAALDPGDTNKSYAAIMANLFLANWYLQSGRATDALGILEPARTKAEALREKSSNDRVWLNALSHVDEQIYLTKWNLGDLEGALTAARQSLDISKQWSDSDQGNTEALQRTANADAMVGNALRKLGRLDDAYASQSAAVTMRQALVAADPNNEALREDLAVSFSRLAEVFMDQKNYSQALDAYQQGLRTVQEAAQSDGAGQNLKQLVGALYAGEGISRLGLNQNAEARQAFQSSLAARKELVERQPDNAGFKQDVEWTTERLEALDRAAAK
jgi:tetratricopeptide (TPR) repeat protein